MSPITRLLLATAALPFAAFAKAPGKLIEPGSPQALLEAGRVDDAVRSLEQSVGDNPFDAVQLNNLAAALARQGNVYAALQLLDRAARLAPNNTAILDNRSRLREWLAAKIGAHTALLDTLPPSSLPAQLPDPPPLWTP